jgi:DNA-directed RNA polymerase specialized sigma24 family protein/LysM repeat protein
MMFEPVPELSHDLDWMLQSGQVSNPELLDRLLQEYLTNVQILVNGMLSDHQLARSAIIEIFSTALANKHDYSSELGHKLWFYDALVVGILRLQKTARRPSQQNPQNLEFLPEDPLQAAIWLATDTLRPGVRQAFLLHTTQGLNIAEIGYLLGVDEDRVGARLEKARQRYLEELQGIAPASQSWSEEQLQERIVQALRARWQESLDETQFEEIFKQILDRAERKSARGLRFNTIKEVVFTGIAALFVVILIWSASQLLPEPEPEITQIAAVARTRTPRSRPSSTRSPTRTTRPTPSPTRALYSPPFPQDVFYYVKPADTLTWIAFQLGTSVEGLARLNRISPEEGLQVGQALLIPGKLTPGPRQATPVPTLPAPEPLDPSASPAEILDRSSRWMELESPVWVDAAIRIHGPRGYRGPPQEYRLQIWAASERTLLLGGHLDQTPSEVLIFSPNIYALARPAAGQPWFQDFYNLSETEAINVRIFNLMNYLGELLVGLTYNDEQYTIEVLGQEQIRGREALILSETDMLTQRVTRTWIDKQTHLPLQQERYYAASPQEPDIEIQYLGFELAVDFPLELADPWLPWRGGFALDASGRPLPVAAQENPFPEQNLEFLPTQTPPADFDPSDKPLLFQYRQAPSIFDEDYRQEGLEAELFADNFYLGSVPLGNPFTVACDRSADGKTLAYFNSFTLMDEAIKFPLHWFSLQDPQQIHTLEGEAKSGTFAFSPQGHELAAIVEQGRVSSQILLIDGLTGESRQIFQTDLAISLFWSPDGEKLALIQGRRTYNQDQQLVVLEIPSGEVLYEGDLGSIERPYQLPEDLSEDWITEQALRRAMQQKSLSDCILPATTESP